MFSASLDPKWPAHKRSSAHVCKRPPRAVAASQGAEAMEAARSCRHSHSACHSFGLGGSRDPPGDVTSAPKFSLLEIKTHNGTDDINFPRSLHLQRACLPLGRGHCPRGQGEGRGRGRGSVWECFPPLCTVPPPLLQMLCGQPRSELTPAMTATTS